MDDTRTMTIRRRKITIIAVTTTALMNKALRDILEKIGV